MNVFESRGFHSPLFHRRFARYHTATENRPPYLHKEAIRIRNATRFAIYLSYVVLACFCLVALMKYEQILGEQAKQTFHNESLLWYSTVYPIAIGLLFGAPHLIRVWKTEGRWSYDWIKAITIGLPALFGSAIFLIYFSPAGALLPTVFVLMLGTKFSMVCGVVFGFVVLTCLQKAASAA